MHVVIGVTDNRWAAFLRDNPTLTEANFWQPSPHGFAMLSSGEPFLFKTKDRKKFRSTDIPGYALVGGAFFDEYVELRVSEAWTIWGRGNGVPDEAELLRRVRSYRLGKHWDDDLDPTIGCVVLRNLFFAERGEELAQPPHWASNIVTHKRYDLVASSDVDAEYVAHAFSMLRSRPRIDPVWDADLTPAVARGDLVWFGERFGADVLVRPRMGQGHFKRAVAEAYRNRCAITASATFPSLEAAHIKPFAIGGKHAVSNGILLRTDVHRLFDRGYLGIDSDLRLRVSPQLRQHGWNGREFYQREAEGYRVAAPDDLALKPDRDALTRHLETVFRAA